MKVKPNNNSANCIAPNLIYGCYGNCLNTYCYMGRYNQKVYIYNERADKIFNAVSKWAENYNKEPDQQDPKYIMVDIACNTDLVLMQKFVDLEYYLKLYDNHPELNTTMATKYPGLLLLDVNHFNKKPRVRVSLMPQAYSDILEPKMQSISSRIKDINRLEALGWEVHINYSPAIIRKDMIPQYHYLFKEVKAVAGEHKCEVIFLTNHEFQMQKANDKARELMALSNQVKNNKGVMRYPLPLKHKAITMFKKEYSRHFNINTIRYIF